MKQDKNREDKLFNTVRSSPLEINLEETKSLFLKNTALVETQKSKTNILEKIFKIKNIIMTTPLIIGIGIFLLTFSDDNPKTTNKIIQLETVGQDLKTINAKDADVLDLDKSMQLSENETAQIEKRDNVLDLAEINTNDKIGPKPKKLNYTEKTKQTIETVELNQAENKVATITQNPKKSEHATPYTYVTLVKPLVRNDSPIPNLTDRQMRKLKRSLYKNLLEDKLISSKELFVEINLKYNSITVNDTKLNNKLYLKYLELTRIVGQGKYRKIELHPDYIKAGDFTEDGFRGTGMGTFTLDKGVDIKSTDQTHNIFETKEITDNKIKEQLESLDQFCDVLLQNSKIYNKKRKVDKGLFSNKHNLNYKMMKQLHADLYKLLLNDNLISDNNQYVLIQIPENEIIINTKLLETNLSRSYLDLMQTHKIKHGPLTMIRLSKNTIRLGIFEKREFTGTSLVLGE